jgi:hypothetical protein
MFDDLIEFVQFLGFMAGLMVLMFVAAAAFVAINDGYGCAQYANATGRDTTYRFPAGCFVQHGDGSWLSMGEYKSVITAREGLK